MVIRPNEIPLNDNRVDYDRLRLAFVTVASAFEYDVKVSLSSMWWVSCAEVDRMAFVELVAERYQKDTR